MIAIHRCRRFGVNGHTPHLSRCPLRLHRVTGDDQATVVPPAPLSSGSLLHPLFDPHDAEHGDQHPQGHAEDVEGGAHVEIE